MIATLSSLLIAAFQVAPQTPPPDPEVEPGISVTINARADSVRWRQVGSVRVRAWAEPSGLLVEENLATGLPRPIPAQRTFRDVEWSLRGEATITAPNVEPGSAEPAAEGEPE